MFDLKYRRDEHLPRLIELAKQQIGERFGLKHLHQNDTKAAEAALWSAAVSFERRYFDGHFAELDSLEELAAHLVHVAVNRFRRALKRQRRIEREVAANQLGSEGAAVEMAEGEPSYCPGPEVAVERCEFQQHVREAIDFALVKLSPVQQRTASEWVVDFFEARKRTQREMAERLSISEPSVSRHIARFQELLRLQIAPEFLEHADG